MSNKIEYNDLFAFHPGYYISEIIDDMEITQAEFAKRMGTTEKTLSKLVNGHINLSNDLAKNLSTMLGSSVGVWLNLQQKYDEKLIEIKERESLDEQGKIMKMIDYSYFENNIGLPPAKNMSEKIKNLCACLMISDLRILTQQDFLVNYRTGIKNVQEKNIVNSQAWLQIALNCAKQMNVDSFDANKLKGFLPEIRSMTLQEPNQFIPRLREIFSSCGVAFVLLPHLKNSGINGAVKWFGNNQVVLALNDRRCNADTFWFSLFHEIKHVLQQKVTKVFISGNNDDFSDMDSLLEKDADTFASNYLIPLNEYEKWHPNKYVTDDEILSFAKKIGIHPGVVAGRLQHDNVIPQNRCSKLKVKYHIVMR